MLVDSASADLDLPRVGGRREGGAEDVLALLGLLAGPADAAEVIGHDSLCLKTEEEASPTIKTKP